MATETRCKRAFLKPLMPIGVLAVLAAATVSTGSSVSCVSEAQSQSCTPPPVGMASWWPGDGDAIDIADGNDGILQGGATFAPGMVGQAFFFDGIDDFVNVGNAPNLRVSTGDFTVDAWVLFNALSHPPGSNTGAPQGDMSIVDKMSGSGVNTDGWRLLKQDDNRFWFCLGGGASGNQCVIPTHTVFSTTQATTGVWFHIAAVKSSTSFSIYVNGQLEDTRSPLPDFLDTNSANLRIGSYVLEGSHLNGLVDEVEIYDRALSAAEIEAIFNAGGAGKCKVTAVEIDIKPGSDPNSINAGSQGVIPVAILTTPSFDAATVNPLSVKLEGAPVRLKGKSGNAGSLEDVDGDGDLDLVVQIFDWTLSAGSKTATLTGQTFSGTPIQGSDSVNVVP